jgi:glutamate formiminotransferase/formiminotetrahydrofolate cyclodeaminase
MQLSYDSLTVIKAMAEIGNPNSASDAGVGALCARTAVYGAFLNVRINASGLDDKTYAAEKIKSGQELLGKTIQLENDILKIVESKI